MKLLLFTLVCLPIALAVPLEVEERSFLGFDLHSLTHLFNTTILRTELQNLVDVVGSDSTELFCETTCKTSVGPHDHTGLLVPACPFICRSLQTLVHQLHLKEPHQQAIQTLKRSLLGGHLLHGVDTAGLKNLVQQLVDMLGSDPAVSLLENECNNIVNHQVLKLACPLISHGFQSLIHSLHVTPQPNTPGHTVNTLRKRSVATNILNSLGLNVTVLLTDAQNMLDVLGSDATEAMMEQYCHDHIFHNHGLLDTSCPLVAKALQSLIQHMHLHPDPGTPGAGGSGTGGIVG